MIAYHKIKFNCLNNFYSGSVSIEIRKSKGVFIFGKLVEKYKLKWMQHAGELYSTYISTKDKLRNFPKIK